MGRQDGPVSSYPGQGQSGMTSSRVAHVAADTALTLNDYASTLVINNETGASDIHLSLTGVTATTSMARIPAGTQFNYYGPPLKSLRFISSGAVGFFNVLAW